MNFSALAAGVISILKGDTKVSIYREYDDSSFSNTENTFASVGISEIKTANRFSDSKGVNCYQSCRICYKVTVFGKNSDGEKLIPIAEGMFLRLFSSSLNIVSVEGGGVSFNTKLNRVQYDFTVTLNARLFGGEVTCSMQNKAVKLNDNFTFLVDSFEFERARGLSEISSICDGVIVGDGGIKPLSLKLRGGFSAESKDVFVMLDSIASLGTALDLSGLGVDVPPMILKKYLFRGEKNEVSNSCELVFWSTDTSEVIAFEK